MKMKFFNILKISCKSILVIMLISSCVTQNKVRMMQEKARDQQQSFINRKKTSYVLQSGDHLYIKVYSVDPKTSKFFQSDFPVNYTSTYLYLNSYMVDEEGYINYSFVDKMYVKGLTIEQTRNLIQKTLNEYFKDATVMVKLVNFQVSVLGEVNSPGTFTIDKDQINLFQAIGMAEGLTSFGNVKNVRLVRQNLKGSDVYYLDLTDSRVLESDYFYLMPNDVVYIEPRGGKSWALEKFPYSVFISIIAIGISIYSVLQ